MASNIFDIIIVGAGPAGLTASFHAAKAGLKVAVVEKASFPKTKICGDGITITALNELKRMDDSTYPAFLALPEINEIHEIQYHIDNNRPFTVDQFTNFYTCNRLHFDNLLYTKAKQNSKVHFFEQFMVSSIQRENELFKVSNKNGTALIGKLLIGADGPNSIVKRTFKPEKQVNVATSIAVRTYFENVNINRKVINMFSKSKLATSGIWVFPLGNKKANIGFGLHDSQIKKHNIHIKQEFLNQINQFPYLKEMLKDAKQQGPVLGATIPLGIAQYSLCSNGLMLVGDAASLADPVNGEGIGYAMVSGRYAAQQAVECLSKNKFSAEFMQQYETNVYAHIGKWNKQSALIANTWLRFPSFITLSAKLLVMKPVYNFVVRNLS